MDAPDTVTEALAMLDREGYDVDFQFVDGEITWEGRQQRCAVDDVVVEQVMRFEGPSDPGDEMIVFGLRDPSTGARGRLASAFGSAADPELVEHLAGLASRFDVDGGAGTGSGR